MDEKKAKSTTKTNEPKATKAAEPVYTVSQLVDGYRAFKAPKFMVIAALKMDGKESYTLAQAEKIISKLVKEEVK